LPIFPSFNLSIRQSSNLPISHVFNIIQILITHRHCGLIIPSLHSHQITSDQRRTRIIILR
jgi:hypothetical protein